jgi:cbb3-type cytochrome oxidase maturation protein
MEVIYLLIPVSLILLGLIVGILLWAVRDGQYDDLEGPAHRILMDEDKIVGHDSEPVDPALREYELQQKGQAKK